MNVFGARIHTNPIWACACTFFYPDYTVGSGVAPDHARFPNKESDVPKQARGLYHRSGIHALCGASHPAPKVIYIVT